MQNNKFQGQTLLTGLGSRYEEMCGEYNVIPDKKFITDVRTLVRQWWGNSPFKQQFMDQHKQMVVNTNPRNMKRYPKVAKFQCAICGEWFGSANVELDHKIGENKLSSLSDLDNFFSTIALPKPEDLQILCKDAAVKRKGRRVVVGVGCHSAKSHAERYNMTFEQAKAYKEYILITKDDALVVDTLKSLGVQLQDIPKTKVGKNRLLKEKMGV